jgi:phenol hydroxylase P4 protein
MAVRAIGEYDFPSTSRAELYGDDQLVHVYWNHNMWFCAPFCFRAPKAMPWSAFLSEIVYPVWGADPDFDPTSSTFTWELDHAALTPRDDATLAELGVGHKSLLTATAA